MASEWALPPVPADLKTLAPYFQRAQELKVKDPVMAYWCMYFAAKQGISSRVQARDARPFLYQVMSVLEQMKASLANNDAVADDDAGAAYIENFALRVFTMADNEDRREQATRSTAKKFLASANFFELLRIFDKPLEPDIAEKIRYAKWKAADLAKAFREGRTPTPGDADAPPAAPADLAPSMSAWSPGTSLAPSPAGHALQALAPSPAPAADVPLPLPHAVAPSTPSPRAFGAQLSLAHDGEVSGLWSTTATPGTEDVYKAGEVMGGISESPSARRAAGGGAGVYSQEPGAMDVHDDAWSTVENQSVSRQNSWTVTAAEDTATGLGLHPDGAPPPPPPPPVHPVKKVHFSPSVVGGLSSTSSSVAGSSPPASPERYAPSLPTVQEVAYSSDSEREPAHPALPCDPATLPLPESGSSASEPEGSPHVVPPVIQKMAPPAPSQLPSAPPDIPASPRQLPLVPQSPSAPPATSPQFPTAPLQFPAAPLQFPAAPPQFPAQHPQAPGPSWGESSLSPQPPAPPALHPTPRFVTPHLAPSHGNHYNHYAPPRPASPPQLTPTQVSRIQKHCRFAISALDYEDAETARKELRAALAMLGD